MAALERRAAFEDKKLAQRAAAKPDQKPGETVVPFQDGFWAAAATVLFVQPIGEKGEIALRDHVCGMASNSSIPMLSCKRQRA